MKVTKKKIIIASICVVSLVNIYLRITTKPQPIKDYNELVSSSPSSVENNMLNDNIQEKVTDSNKDTEKATDIDELSTDKPNEYQKYVLYMCAFDFIEAGNIAGESMDAEVNELYKDSAMLIYFMQLKANEDQASISKKLQLNTIKNPINFFVASMYINSYYRTPLIYCQDSLNPEFDVMGNLSIEEVDNTYNIGEEIKTYEATFDLDGYRMKSIFYSTEDGYRIYRIDSEEEVPFITVEKFSEIRRGTVNESKN